MREYGRAWDGFWLWPHLWCYTRQKVGKEKLSWQAKFLACQSFNLWPTSVSIVVIERTRWAQTRLLGLPAELCHRVRVKYRHPTGAGSGPTGPCHWKKPSEIVGRLIRIPLGGHCSDVTQAYSDQRTCVRTRSLGGTGYPIWLKNILGWPSRSCKVLLERRMLPA